MTTDDFRGAYKEFLNSEVGRDFLNKLIVHETDLKLTAFRSTDPNVVHGCVSEERGVYWVRTLLDDLSKPSTPARAAEHSRGPKSS